MKVSSSVPLLGAVAGVAGAAVLAAWFFAVDLVRGEPFATVGLVSSALLGQESGVVNPGAIAIYTLLHVAVFVGIGVGVAWVFERLPVAPNVLFGIALGFLLFDGFFYLGVGISGAEVVNEVGWAQMLAGNLLAGITVMGVLRALGPGRAPSWWESLSDNQVLREGLVAGVLGGTVVAVWFLIRDLAMGTPFFTPGALGSAVLLGISTPEQIRTDLAIVVGYSVIHFGSFVAVGIAASGIASQAEDTPAIVLLGLLIFAAFAAFLMGILAIFAEWVVGALAWWNIALGNLLATAVMAWYLLRAHPRLRQSLMEGRIE